MVAKSVSKDRTASTLPPEARRHLAQDKIDPVLLEMLASMKKLPPKLRSLAFADFMVLATMLPGITSPTGKGAHHG